MTITIGDITTGSIDGTGDFDILMKTAKLHLQEEYSKGRITGDKYAEAYIAMMGQVLGASIQFKLQAEQVNKQSELTDEQKALIVAQTAQVTAETLNVPKQGIVLDKQSLKLTEDTKLVTAQILNVPKEGIILDKQAANLDKDIAVKDKQLLNIQSQIDLTDQKTKTEKAQIVDQIDGVDVKGTVGKQKEVYTAQIKGFENDAVQKATKTMTDIWSVQRSTDVGIQPTAETKLYDSNIGSAVAKLFGNLNIPLATVPMAAYVNAASAVNGSDTIQAGESVSVNGNLGDSGVSVISVTARDTDSKVVSSGNITLNGKVFTCTIAAAEILKLKAGDVVVTAKIRTNTGTEISVSDSIRKGY